MTATTASVQDIIETSREYARRYMDQYDSSHDYSHVLRVLSMSKHIEACESQAGASNQPFDSNVITLVALLHDVGDRKYLKLGQDGKTEVLQFLLSIGADEQLATDVQHIINNISYSNEVRNPADVTAAIAKHPELAVVQDADRLDALGAVGIGRCFAFNASRSSKDGMESAIQHFTDKLLKLSTMMKTETGRALAIERTRRISTFREWWMEESRSVPDEI